MATHKETLQAIRSMRTDLIFVSAKNPSSFMSKFNILMHYVVLRERGAL